MKLAKKIRSIDKKFFFIRTKIDENVRAEKRKWGTFNEDAMLESIRCNISEHLGDLLTSEQEIFLISNHHPAKWDFARLTEATTTTATSFICMTVNLLQYCKSVQLSSRCIADISTRESDLVSGHSNEFVN